ncbi:MULTISPECIES: helix-turn-helix transcriptional regulator [unclassified Aeromicrobium]|jgi:transcriptional regulator with XRE-family HTH domain|uniref:helix-turn-helix domain-containing protein n=1 Tax=unclassified Aeromicrobium TaxID=2633570 RepID=UPI000A8B0EB4|nr:MULTISPECIES: helix-turn-helix transcriptional regulator [unclassified Aeromicrobium]
MPGTQPSGRSEGGQATLAELGHRVAARRTELGLSLASVAEAVGVHHSTLSRLERGQQDLGASHLPMLAQALDISVADLFPST